MWQRHNTHIVMDVVDVCLSTAAVLHPLHSLAETPLGGSVIWTTHVSPSSSLLVILVLAIRASALAAGLRSARMFPLPEQQQGEGLMTKLGLTSGAAAAAADGRERAGTSSSSSSSSSDEDKAEAAAAGAEPLEQQVWYSLRTATGVHQYGIQ